MQSILFSLLIAYTRAFGHESKGIIIKTKNETNYLATTRLKNTVQGNLEAPQTIPFYSIKTISHEQVIWRDSKFCKSSFDFHEVCM